MTAGGVDYADARPTQAQLQAAGATFVCRYVMEQGRTAFSDRKRLTADEAHRLSDWGLDIVCNFEFATAGVLNGRAQGIADAQVALAELHAVGATRNVVYFSCDQDISISQIPAVLAYLAGCREVLGYSNVGVYGEYDLIEAAGRAGYWCWQTYAWSRGLVSGYAHIYQYDNGAFQGWDGDLDRALKVDFGQWSFRKPGPGGPRDGYPTLFRGTGGVGDSTGSWWAGQWYALMAEHSPGYYAEIAADPAGSREIAGLEVGDATLRVAHKMAAQVLGDKLAWHGAITRQVWAIYPPVPAH